MIHACLENRLDDVKKFSEKVGLNPTSKDLDTQGKDLMKRIMRRWLPAGDCMLEMIVHHLPSPVEAQQYRTELLYEGPLDDEVAVGLYYLFLLHFAQ